MWRLSIAAAAAALAIASAAAAGSPTIHRTTPEDFAASVTTTDDSLDTVVKFDEGNAHPHTVRLPDVAYLRVFLDKRSGHTSFQLYAATIYRSPWRFYRAADYATDDGPVYTELTQISSNVGPCYGGCLLQEVFGFEVPEAVLRTMAAKYAADPGGVWAYKFDAKDGSDWRAGTPYAEIAGMLSVVDSYRAEHHLSRDTPKR